MVRFSKGQAMSSMDICICYSAEQKFDYQTRRDRIRIHDILIFSVENYMKHSSLIPVALTEVGDKAVLNIIVFK